MSSRRPSSGRCPACSCDVLLVHVPPPAGSSRRSPILALSPLPLRSGEQRGATALELERFEADDGRTYLEHRCRRARPQAPTDREGRVLEVTRCRACGGAVRWIVTPAGKRAPCDAEGIEGTLVDEKPAPPDRVRGFTAAGESVVVSTVPTLLPGELATVYVSHFATCPEADRFRRKRGAR